jgi:hypothetical protein
VDDARVDFGDASAGDSGGGGLSGSRYPAFDNPSFELTSGAPEGGTLGGLSSTQISPWYTCSGSVSARPEDDLRNSPVGAPEPTDLLAPSDQETLVSMSFGAGPATLIQTLREPLERDALYAFAIDVVRSGTADLRLQVWGANGSCLPLERLTESDAVPMDGKFETICLSFTPTSDYRELFLVTSPATGARLFIDNIRPATSCP